MTLRCIDDRAVSHRLSEIKRHEVDAGKRRIGAETSSTTGFIRLMN
jgi:hypothetical protein